MSLLPCPFCAGTPYTIPGTDGKTLIHCGKCSARMVVYSHNHSPWNERAKPSCEAIYVASRVSRAPMWRILRADGMPIVSTWIDEAGDNETDDFTELWRRIQSEISQSSAMIFYGDVEDAPWKGAFIEIGMALALGKPVLAVILGELEDRTMRPIGSWLAHPNVRQFSSLDAALAARRQG